MIRTIECQLLAMPAPMRSLLLQQAVYQSIYIPRHHLSTSTTTLSSPQPSPSSPQPLSAPLSFLPSPSNNPVRTPIPAPTVPPPLLTTSTTILTTPPPRFLYSAPRFLNLPMNTRVPEICLLGRSNVGKSTLINALAGIPSSSAGRSHGSNVSSAKKKSGPGSNVKGLAITSAKAGCTRTLNGYAFGLPTAPFHPPKKDATENTTKGPAATRSERRLLASRNHDPTPQAALVLMDMPGYGQNSREEWGVEIAKYLSRRKMLRGAVLLIDAVAGVKDGDRMVLRLLRDANVRTTIVLTKADKLGYGMDREGTKGVVEVGKMCESVWDLLRDLERGTVTWTEGKGWEREIWVTGAGDPRTGGMGVEGARFAIARMAGLVSDEREVGRVVEKPAQRIVPFEELQWRGSGSSGRFEVRA
ncbi:hypothetical protein CONLIGDRAFT_636339 [Coniochaeta ligniaria NRRL 30616]|uniref:EngB-type G domain-containing protein n=1 Tax=Coniochaeta ligniaria NRRL 30616 TaxID=1408157 RepID=A0A1J7JCF6_9PEZI|nr:hypothetical protein CONLIGDRAFT_636339 [Coniochaeta ligniaria NRRL 30616]